MSKIITVIQLLNRTANGEEVPIEIKFQNIIYVFNKECNQYYERGKGSYFDNKLKFDKTIEWNFYGDYLNEEVEVLEDNTEDNTEEIEELDEEWTYIEGQIEKTWSKSELELVNKINEIIKYIKRKDKSND